MSELDELVIELSKKKLALLLVGALIFLALGVWMFTLDDATIEAQRRFSGPTYVHGVGIAGIVFAAVCGVVGALKLFETKPGLVISSKGIFDNSSGVAAGLIPWTEIKGFSVYEIHRQKMLVVLLFDPEKYVARGGAIKQALNRANLKLCGSPIAISSNILKIDFPGLTALLAEYHRKYGNKFS